MAYVFGNDDPDVTFDTVTRILSCRRRPGSDAVILTPQRSEDLQNWQSGPDSFVFVGETRDAAGRMWQKWIVPGAETRPNLFLRIRIDAR